MIHETGKTTVTGNQPLVSPRYDSKSLATALKTLSRSEVETMLEQVSSLETRIQKLHVSGEEDEMMRVVSDGLSRLSYFLDAVKRYKDEIGDTR